mmetsp:Transcript_4253/g.13621  ORF Transcript_4253/g.13621 Transcript_4253/m.13621 type:complete len:218 (-) Transcript_4253:1711-2364(-)
MVAQEEAHENPKGGPNHVDQVVVVEENSTVKDVPRPDGLLDRRQMVCGPVPVDLQQVLRELDGEPPQCTEVVAKGVVVQELFAEFRPASLLLDLLEIQGQSHDGLIHALDASLHGLRLLGRESSAASCAATALEQPLGLLDEVPNAVLELQEHLRVLRALLLGIERGVEDAVEAVKLVLQHLDQPLEHEPHALPRAEAKALPPRVPQVNVDRFHLLV